MNIKTIGLYCAALLFSPIDSFGHEEGESQELYQVGEVKTSLLEPDEFTDRYGTAWVLMDGRDVSGSEFASLTAQTSVPDGRGKFLRMSNNGASGEEFDPDKTRILGSYQPDAFKNHVHQYTNPQGSSNIGHFNSGGWEGTLNADTTNTGSAETRPKNISVNFYVKIRSCSNKDEVCL